MKKLLYQVQLEAGDKIVSYEIATNDFDAVDVAKENFLKSYPELTKEDIHLGGYCTIGYHKPLCSPYTEATIVSKRVNDQV